jgi:Ca-activated chloride channel homolog
MSRCVRRIVVLMTLPVFCLAQDTANLSDNFRISLSVERVPLYVTVRDPQGNLVDGLTEKAFNILQDNRPQIVREFRREDVPIAVGLILDNSGSMMFKSKEVLAAANAFIASRADQDEFFVVHFNSAVRFGLPPEIPFSKSRDDLSTAINSFRTTGETALYDAAYAALKHLEKSVFPKKVLILISDGGDTASQHQAHEVFDLADRSGVLFYSIGLYDSRTQILSPRTLRNLAQRTGGEAYFPKTGPAVIDICRQIAQDLRQQYTIVYSPNNPPRDKRYHSIRVLVRNPPGISYRVYARSGYYANGSGPMK